eukprot:COSAG01_NODE_59758_length_298_cov_1.030151_1_plen_46_part_10
MTTVHSPHNTRNGNGFDDRQVRAATRPLKSIKKRRAEDLLRADRVS